MVKPWLRNKPPEPPATVGPPAPATANAGFGALIESARADLQRELTALRAHVDSELATIHANHAADMKIVEAALEELRNERSKRETLPPTDADDTLDLNITEHGVVKTSTASKRKKKH